MAASAIQRQTRPMTQYQRGPLKQRNKANNMQTSSNLKVKEMLRTNQTATSTSLNISQQNLQRLHMENNRVFQRPLESSQSQLSANIVY